MHQAPLAHCSRHGVVHHDGNERDDAEIAAQNQRRSQRVRHAALEDQVRVHQPVAHDGPCEGERQKHQREAGEIGQQVRRIELQQVRNRVKERERQNREQRSARDPLQLLTQQRRAGAAVAAQKQQRRQDVEQGDRSRWRSGPGGRARAWSPRACPPTRSTTPAAPAPGAYTTGRSQRRRRLLKRSSGKLSAKCRKSAGCSASATTLVQKTVQSRRVEIAGVLESVERERDQAKEIKMRGAGRAPAAEENIEADDEIDQSDDAQAILQAVVRGHKNHLHRRVEGNAVAGDAVANLDVGAGSVERALQIGDRGDGYVIHRGQQVIDLNEGVLAGHAWQHTVGDQTPVRLVPPHAVRGLLKFALLQKIEDSQHEQSRSRQGQQRSLHAIEEAFVHTRGISYAIWLLARELPRRVGASMVRLPMANRLNLRMILTRSSVERHKSVREITPSACKTRRRPPEKEICL